MRQPKSSDPENSQLENWLYCRYPLTLFFNLNILLADTYAEGANEQSAESDINLVDVQFVLILPRQKHIRTDRGHVNQAELGLEFGKAHVFGRSNPQFRYDLSKIGILISRFKLSSMLWIGIDTVVHKIDQNRFSYCP